MTRMIEELDYQLTPLGELVLRRRWSPNVPGGLVYEVKLGDEMLMSSSVNASERALATLAMSTLGARANCDVLVGGLGLGCTAAAVLDFTNVRRMDVIELLTEVIEWHRAALVPLAKRLMSDSRCSLIQGNFFEWVGKSRGDADSAYDVIIFDIDHSPDCLLQLAHAEFYTRDRLRCAASHLSDGGVFGLWSAILPSEEFVQVFRESFDSVRLHEISFLNPHISEQDSNWILLGKAPSRREATCGS